MTERPYGRMQSRDHADHRHLAEVESLLREKRVRTPMEAFVLIAAGNGIYDPRSQRSFAERLRRKLKSQRTETQTGKQGIEI